MKKVLLTIILILIFFLGGLSINYNQDKDENNNPIIKQENVDNDIEPEKNEYIDNNPIKLGLYKYYGRVKERELIKEYNATWQYHQDISSFEVYYTNEEFITNSRLKETFDNYKNNYVNIDNYKIGYQINFLTNDKEYNKPILSPKDTEEFFDYLEIYLYDDYHREPGVWYSHTLEEEMNDETLLTSIKLTAGKLISEIKSDISVTAFTYDYDDFDETGNYRGISKYTIVVKNNQ